MQDRSLRELLIGEVDERSSITRPEMPCCKWIKRNGLSYGAHVPAANAGPIEILVELSYSEGWNWTVWRPAAEDYLCQRGVQATLELAKRQACRAAVRMR